jgi:hypothetical protein
MTMLKVPESIGPNKLAYITDNEKKLLRRREAVKGFPSKKVSSEGVPVLADSRAAIIAHAKGLGIANVPGAGVSKKEFKRFTDRLNAEKKLRTKGGTQSWVKSSTAAQNKRSSDWYSTPAGAAYAKSLNKPVGFGIRTPKKPKKPVKQPTTTTSTPAVTTTSTSASPATISIEEDVSTVLDQSQIQAPVLEEIVVHGPESEVIQERLKNLINTNSPLFKAATTKALQSMNQVGLTNSSIAQEAVMNSILSVAIPIASADAEAFMAQRMANQNASNSFKAAQNQAYYSAFVAKLNGQVNETLRRLGDRAANWRAVLQERGRIAATAGMSAEAAEQALKTVTPTWWGTV